LCSWRRAHRGREEGVDYGDEEETQTVTLAPIGIEGNCDEDGELMMRLSLPNSALGVILQLGYHEQPLTTD
jgi:hypothetical protein